MVQTLHNDNEKREQTKTCVKSTPTYKEVLTLKSKIKAPRRLIDTKPWSDGLEALEFKQGSSEIAAKVS